MVIYKDGNTRGSWASQGVDRLYLGPLMDHYRCDLYYIPKTRAYRILGSTELFFQHCQMPNMTLHQHFCALTDKLVKLTAIASATDKGKWLIKILQSKIEDIHHPPALANTTQAEQRDETPILTIPRITDTPPIMQARNPTVKRVLKNTLRIHRRLTQNNTPGSVPLIRRVYPILVSDLPEQPPMTIIAPPSRRRLLRTQHKATTPPTTRRSLPLQATQRIVMQQAMNVLTIKEKATFNARFTPRDLMQHAVLPFAHHLNTTQIPWYIP